MPEEKETRKKLQECARAEFMEKGFLSASLRNICKRAGVTTGALYCFFKDKDDLFVSLVKEPLERINTIMLEHYSGERENAADGSLFEMDSSGDYEACMAIIHEMYHHREEFLLLLTKAQGTSLEHAIDSIVEISGKHYRALADAMQEALYCAPVADETVHWLAHMQIDIFIYMITHIPDEEEAAVYIQEAVRFMEYGWFGMFGVTQSQENREE